MKILWPLDIVRGLIEAGVRAGHVDAAEIADFADALYTADMRRWALVEASPKALLALLRRHGNFEKWTAEDDARAKAYASLASEPPPVVVYFPPESLGVAISILDGRHRLVGREGASSIAVCVPADAVARLRAALFASASAA